MKNTFKDTFRQLFITLLLIFTKKIYSKLFTHTFLSSVITNIVVIKDELLSNSNKFLWKNQFQLITASESNKNPINPNRSRLNLLERLLKVVNMFINATSFKNNLVKKFKLTISLFVHQTSRKIVKFVIAYLEKKRKLL